MAKVIKDHCEVCSKYTDLAIYGITEMVCLECRTMLYTLDCEKDGRTLWPVSRLKEKQFV